SGDAAIPFRALAFSTAFCSGVMSAYLFIPAAASALFSVGMILPLSSTTVLAAVLVLSGPQTHFLIASNSLITSSISGHGSHTFGVFSFLALSSNVVGS